MSRKLRFALFTHSLTSDWNNGNAHFLRGLARALVDLGHSVVCWEEREGWSQRHLLKDEGDRGTASVAQFSAAFPELSIKYHALEPEVLASALAAADVGIVHEWHTPEFIALLLTENRGTGCRLLFHDTHHRASSSPAQIEELQIGRFDGVLAFGQGLRDIYMSRFGLRRVWTLHEAADTSVFFPKPAVKKRDVAWVGNWGDDERTLELQKYLISPASCLSELRWLVFGVRYPVEALRQLEGAGIQYGGYLANLDSPEVYRSSRLTLHVPRQQYRDIMRGIPTIRVFEALAMGIPLISAPWEDSEGLFYEGDYLKVQDSDEMVRAVRMLINEPEAAEEQAKRGLETILSRHTCRHRAEELSRICEEVLA